MAVKRGASGLCLVVGVDKPSGMSSHDVVNRCRRIFGERRVGHTGTLDPMASGVLPICIGPATRLDAYLTGHDKHYVVDVAFGVGTDTDDAEGEEISRGAVPSCIFDKDFADAFVANLVGRHSQMPPLYSAIKVDGKKACDAARKGQEISLEPRDIEVFSAELLAIVHGLEDQLPCWRIAFHVSKGTYIRSLARDIGAALQCPAHVRALRRIKAGSLELEDCVSLATLEEIGVRAALDPVCLLGYRVAFLDDAQARAVQNGQFLQGEPLLLHEVLSSDAQLKMCSCSAGVCVSSRSVQEGEIVSLVWENKLMALYAYEAGARRYRARCIFQTGVSRGQGR